MVTSFWNKTVLSYKVWIFEIDFLSSFRTNSLWKQPVERLIARSISWKDLFWKFRAGQMLTKSHCFFRGRILLVAKEFSAWINLYSIRGESIGLYCSFILYGHIHTYACQRMGLSAAVNNEQGSYSSRIRYFFVWTFCMLRLGLYSGPVTWTKIKVLALLYQCWAAGRWVNDGYVNRTESSTLDLWLSPQMVKMNLQVELNWKHQCKEVAQSRLLISR